MCPTGKRPTGIKSSIGVSESHTADSFSQLPILVCGTASQSQFVPHSQTRDLSNVNICLFSISITSQNASVFDTMWSSWVKMSGLICCTIWFVCCIFSVGNLDASAMCCLARGFEAWWRQVILTYKFKWRVLWASHYCGGNSPLLPKYSPGIPPSSYSLV